MPGPSGPYYAPTGELIVPQSTLVEIGDVVSGPGIQPGTTVTNITLVSGPMGDYLSVTLSAIPWTGSYAPPGVNTNPQTSGLTGLTFIFESNITFSRMEFVQVPNPIDNLLSKTLSFKEDIKGWVSFKSFTPENAISMANDYYTFVNANLYKHHIETVDRNTFYEGDVDFPFTASSFNVILNNAPGSIKSFSTLNYEGSQTKVDIPYDDNGVMINDGEYFNLIAKKGWYVESIETDLEKGSLNEFIDKEGKWFNYLKGQNVITNPNGLIVVNPDGSSSFDQASFAIQGIGVSRFINDSEIECERCDKGQLETEKFFGVNTCPEGWVPVGTADPCGGSGLSCYQCVDRALVTSTTNAIYVGDGWACPEGWVTTQPDCSGSLPSLWICGSITSSGSDNCTEVLPSDPTYANHVIGSSAWLSQNQCNIACQVYGCTDPLALNYYSGATIDDGSCYYETWDCDGGVCIDNVLGTGIYNSLSACNLSCGGVISTLGCTDPIATNYDPSAITDDGSCVYCVTTTGNVIVDCSALVGSSNWAINWNFTIPNWTTVTNASWWRIVNVSNPTVAIGGGTWTWQNYASVIGGTTSFPNGDYILEVYHLDSSSTNYDPTATLITQYCESFTVSC